MLVPLLRPPPPPLLSPLPPPLVDEVDDCASELVEKEVVSKSPDWYFTTIPFARSQPPEGATILVTVVEVSPRVVIVTIMESVTAVSDHVD
jgi:hypothetical protein